MLEVLITRNGNKIIHNANNEISVLSIMKKEGYQKVNPLDIKGYEKIKWVGIEFNNLFTKDGVLYRFNNWLGVYPYDRIEIEEIGTVE